MAFVAGVLLISCSGGSTSGAAEEATAEEAATTEEAGPKYSQETAVGVFHDVADVDAWTAAYESMSDPEGRIVVMTSNENPNRLAVLEWTESHAAGKEFFGSDDFKAITDSIGVVGEIQTVYYDIKELDDQPALQYAIAIGHEVSDYDAWKVKFDEDADARNEAGVKFEALSTDADNPNMVYIMFSTNDLDGAMEMIESEDLKQKMADAGVIGEPEVSIWVSPTSE